MAQCLLVSAGFICERGAANKAAAIVSGRGGGWISCREEAGQAVKTLWKDLFCQLQCGGGMHPKRPTPMGCMSCSENKTQSLSGFVRTGKCLLGAKKISRVFPAPTLQKVGCQRVPAHLLLGPRGDRENHQDVTQRPGVMLETTKSQRLCNICNIRTEESRER